MARKSRRQRLIRNLPAVIPIPDPEPELKDRFGRNTKFRLEMLDWVRVLCEEGATDKEIATELGVSPSTLYLWRNVHPELAAVMKLGKEPADDRLERTAYDVAVGYTTTVRVHVKVRNSDGSEKMMEVEQEVRIPPNPDMLKWMLKNRRPDTWRDRTETAVTGEVVHLTADQAKERLRAKLEEIKAKALGGNSPAAG